MGNPEHITIISGGQTGTDRAALDFGLKHGIPVGGWCPKGRLAEDGPIDPSYPLLETSSEDPAERTRANVDASNGMVLIYLDMIDEGTRLALQFCKSLGKPVLLVNREFPPDQEEFSGWLLVNGIRNLNIAGPRESNAPGVYSFAYSSLEALLCMEDGRMKMEE